MEGTQLEARRRGKEMRGEEVQEMEELEQRKGAFPHFVFYNLTTGTRAVERTTMHRAPLQHSVTASLHSVRKTRLLSLEQSNGAQGATKLTDVGLPRRAYATVNI